MAPLHRRKHRRDRILAVLFVVFALWLIGVRIHFERLAPQSFKPRYFRIELNDGKVVNGKILHDSIDAVSVLSNGRKMTFTRGQIAQKRALTDEELLAAAAAGEVKLRAREPLVTLYKEDNFFYALSSSWSFKSSDKDKNSGIAEMASKATGVPKEKIEKALANPDQIKSLTPEQIQKYTQKARERGINV